MILTCPSCSARFLVPDTAIGKQGRRVRCGKCQHQWFCAPTAEAAGAAIAPDIDKLMREGSVKTEAPKLRPVPPGSGLPANPPRAPSRIMVAACGLLLLVNIFGLLMLFAPSLVGLSPTTGLAL